MFFFLCKQKRAYEMRISDWSSDVCSSDRHADRKASGHISTVEARQIMREMGATEPTDRAALLRSFSAPSPCQQERGAEHWPINLHGPCAEDKAWSFIIG